MGWRRYYANLLRMLHIDDVYQRSAEKSGSRVTRELLKGHVSFVTALQNKSLQTGREAIQEQPTQVENEIHTIHIGNAQQQGHLDALSTVRDSPIKQNKQNITDTTYSRLLVVSLAKDAAPQLTQKTPNILLGLLVGTLAGVAIGFIYNSGFKALKRELDLEPLPHAADRDR